MKDRAERLRQDMKLLSQYGPNPYASGMGISLYDICYWLIAIEDGQKPANDPPHQTSLDLQTGEFIAINTIDEDCPGLTSQVKAEQANPWAYGRPTITRRENRDNKIRIRQRPERFLEIPILGHQVWKQWFKEFLKSRGRAYEYFGDLDDCDQVNTEDRSAWREDYPFWEEATRVRTCQYLAGLLRQVGYALVLKP